MREWWQQDPIIEEHDGVIVVREDLCEGGSKIRFLPHLVGDAKEIVFGGPFCGGAPYALSVWGQKKGVKITLFYAKRKELHRRQKAAFANGAQLFQVPFGYMTNVQAKARAYARDHGALFLPLGFDIPEACSPFVEYMRSVRGSVGKIDQVWCATGSGMLARCLSEAFPDAEIHGVIVGLKSRNQKQEFRSNVILHECRYDFAEETRAESPFPSCGNYDRKAWEICQREGKGRRLFWNVLA